MKKQLLIIAASLSLIPVGNLFAQQNQTFIKNTETVIAKNISHNNHNESLLESGDNQMIIMHFFKELFQKVI